MELQEAIRSRVLELGDEGPDVRELQELLALRGYSVLADGDFGPKTHLVVRHFQRDHGLKWGGNVGALTLQLLRLAPEPEPAPKPKTKPDFDLARPLEQDAELEAGPISGCLMAAVGISVAVIVMAIIMQAIIWLK